MVYKSNNGDGRFSMKSVVKMVSCVLIPISTDGVYDWDSFFWVVVSVCCSSNTHKHTTGTKPIWARKRAIYSFAIVKECNCEGYNFSFAIAKEHNYV